MFSYVCLSTGGPCDAFDLTVQRLLPPLPLQTIDPMEHPLLVTSGGQDWRPVQICSLKRQPPRWSWHLVAIWEAHAVSASGLCASYWNAFLLKVFVKIRKESWQCGVCSIWWILAALHRAGVNATIVMVWERPLLWFRGRWIGYPWSHVPSWGGVEYTWRGEGIPGGRV